MKDLFYYSAYGLNITSELLLPELEANDSNSDVFIYEKKNGTRSDGNMKRLWRLKISEEKKSASLFIKNQATFNIREGKEITVYTEKNSDDQLIRQYIMGIIFGILLYQRELLVLHASAVEFDGGAIAFMGNPEAGKSSVAAALYNKGYKIVTDDITPVDVNSEISTVFPGFPYLKIGQKVAGGLGYDFESLGIIHSLEEKRLLDVHNRFQKKPLPLRCIFVLADGNAQGVEELHPQETVIELIRHTFPTRLQQPGAKLHFMQCAELVNRVPVYRLKQSKSISALPELITLIEKKVGI